VKETKAQAPGISDQGQARGQNDRRLRRARQGQHALELLRHSHGFPRLHVDRSPHKQGNFLPGSRIPILHPDMISNTRPDYVLILPWNLKDEIMQQMAHVREWGGNSSCRFPR
jgi:hypothetical protein